MVCICIISIHSFINLIYRHIILICACNFIRERALRQRTRLYLHRGGPCSTPPHLHSTLRQALGIIYCRQQTPSFTMIYYYYMNDKSIFLFVHTSIFCMNIKYWNLHSRSLKTPTYLCRVIEFSF